VKGLEGRVEALAATNALMREDLDISRASLLKEQAENRRLTSEISRQRRKATGSDLSAAKEEVRAGQTSKQRQGEFSESKQGFKGPVCRALNAL